MTRRFKQGDRVRLVRRDYMNAPIGSLATVRGYLPGYSNSTEYLDVKWDRSPGGHSQMDGGYYEDNFELAEERPCCEVDRLRRELDVERARVRVLECDLAAAKSGASFRRERADRFESKLKAAREALS